MISNVPKNDKEFNALMEDIDSLLRKRDVPIYKRPILAPLEIRRRLNISLPLIPIQRNAIPGEYTGNSLSSHIQDWYEKTYGDRLKAHMRVGTGVILIKDEPWQVTYPLILGPVNFICDLDFEKYENLPTFTINGTTPKINIFNLIADFPRKFAESLTHSEVKEIKEVFLAGLHAVSYLDQIKQLPIVKEAKADLGTAVMHILGQPPQFGLSKYASLQFSEKLLKAYLSEKKVKYPFTHNLSELRKLSIDNGLTPFPEALIDNIQCTAGVRYGHVQVSLEESIKAHYSSLGICYHASKAISSLKKPV